MIDHSTVRPTALVPMLNMFAEQMGLRWSLIEMPGLNHVVTVSSQPLDYGTLPESLRLAAQYLRPSDGDVILTNDPTSGANHTFEVTLMTPIALGRERGLLGLRFESGDWRMTPGPRVPPIPVVQNGELIAPLLEHFPSNWNLRESLSELRNLKASVERAFKNYQSTVWQKSISRTIEAGLDEWPHKDSLYTWTLSTGDRVELNLDRVDRVIHMDFSATPASAYGGFTERMILGLCLKSLETVLEWVGPTQNWTDYIALHTKAQTLVHNKAGCDLAVVWAHPLAMEMFHHICRSLADWTHRPVKLKGNSAALLEWYSGDTYESVVTSYLHRSWPLPQQAGSNGPFILNKNLVRLSEAQRTNNEKGTTYTHSFRVLQPCTFNFWLPDAKHSTLKLTTTEQKEELITGQVSGAIEVAKDEVVSVCFSVQQS